MAEEQPTEKSVMLFGRDVTKIPCFRNSFLYGTLGGLAFGLTHFMFTSKIGKSANYSVYSFYFITMGYWIFCRYEYSKTKFEMLRMQEALREHIMNEGTEKDPLREQTVEVIDV